MDTHTSIQDAHASARSGSRLPFVLFFAFGLIFITGWQLDFFRAIPGDLGDSRFNSLILEHLYRWIIGTDKSLWSPAFFYPYPGAFAFSDNHFGTFIVYVLLRALGASSEYAFIGWYVAAIPLNYACCYYALRQFGQSERGGAAGAFIYTFSFIVAGQFTHAQLSYRFAIPLAMLAWRQLIQTKDARHLATLAIWTTIQFLCSIYLGYFLLLLLGASFLALYLSRADNDTPNRPHRVLLDIVAHIRARRTLISLCVVAACIAVLAFLFYPYVYYSKLYGFHRHHDEIAALTPRLLSYVMADNSWLWRDLSARLPDVPARGEQQLFIGLSVAILLVIGCIVRRDRWSRNALWALILLALLTVNVHGHSVYFLLERLPIAKSIRAVARIGLVMLFPIALLAGKGYDWLTDVRRTDRGYNMPRLAACALVTLLLLAELGTETVRGVPVTDWRARLASLKAQVPANLPADAILFIPLRTDRPLFMSELDGMSVAQALNMDTLNGYSGFRPTDYDFESADPCQEVMLRLNGYVKFAGQDTARFRDLVQRTYVLDGKDHCSPLAAMIQRTHFTGPVPADIVSHTSVDVESVSSANGKLTIALVIHNDADQALPAISDEEHPVRASWRFIDPANPPGPAQDWETRADLPTDVPAHGSIQITVSANQPAKAGTYRIQTSLVQEAVFWFHDKGAHIATSKQSLQIGTDGSVHVLE